ncbi:FAD/NAD(P)-binding domain-containing protein [Neolentinus lepideus HHB14362 ss-1]|uniref:FAD/NAD(P)-binding domain-containing protein n=1 Tax=Neolentinus lepideus HHB14362 ss-1 TaxID=1314782 RepID=A0A165UWJ7_9AGAM|nr:FAD/NAD(P)-binding domain-containing protein [Neolentinus lepideus HHB14362 ss-1]
MSTMGTIGRLSSLLSALAFPSSKVQSDGSKPEKAIAIVGAGTGGIAALKALLDLPEDIREGWQVDVLEQTAHVGGMWVPEPSPPSPPDLPNTPLYPALQTNTPHPTMTYPNFPFPPMTPLFPPHDVLKKYHEDYVQHFNLTPYIRFNHTVLSAVYDSPSHQWSLTIRDPTNNTSQRRYDHLIVAKGNNRYPYSPTWPGQDEWISSANGQRQVLHSLWYREPEKYTGHLIVVVGDGASGRDMAVQTLPLAKEVYHSYDTKTLRPIVLAPVPGVTLKPRISHFTRSSIVFVDGTTLDTPKDTKTTVLLGTGFACLVPWLPQLAISQNGVDSSTVDLTTNRRYIRPLFRHVLSLDVTIPPDRLAFVGLPWWIANAPSDYAQGLLTAHAIADPSWLPSKEELIDDLNAQENALRVQGIDPYRYGHAFASEVESEAYVNGIIDLLRSRSPVRLPDFLADKTVPYLAPWRRRAREQTFFMRRGWIRAEELGVEKQFLEGAETEDKWAEKIRMLEEWTREQEEGKGRIEVVEEPL